MNDRRAGRHLRERDAGPGRPTPVEARWRYLSVGTTSLIVRVRLAVEVTRSLAEVVPVRAVVEAPGAVPDEELIARCRRGDRAALGELYRRYRSEALRFVRHAARTSQDAEDILQEVFVEVAGSIRSFAGRSSFSGWLRSLCVRTAMRHMRRRHRQVGEPEDRVDEKAERTLPSGEDPGESYERRERARRIDGLLGRIAPKKRLVLILHDFEGVSPKEIGELVGAPVLTVRTRLFYARKELAALAAKDPMLAQDLAPWLADKGAAP